mgnify:CR=1 FL=1
MVPTASIVGWQRPGCCPGRDGGFRDCNFCCPAEELGSTADGALVKAVIDRLLA